MGALALAVAAVLMTSGSATALNGLPIECTAAGTVLFQNSGSGTSWQLVGKGSCQGDLEGTYFLDFTGAGTSDSLGNCDAMQGGGVVPVTNLDIAVAATLTNANTQLVKAESFHWTAPVTTYPIVTPFLIQKKGNPVGAGVFFNHIFVQCLNSPVAQFSFSFFP